MRSTVRTFIAIEIPPEMKDRAMALVSKLRASNAKVKWVGPDEMHWTLKFLGEVDLNEIPAICCAVSEAVTSFAPFDIEAQGAGAFPDLTRPRTVWIGVGDGADPMVALHDAIETALEPLGFRPEARRFRPHLTIGRVRQSSDEGIQELGRLVQQNTDFDGGLSSVFEVVILSSELGRHGPTYEPLGRAELEG